MKARIRGVEWGGKRLVVGLLLALSLVSAVAPAPSTAGAAEAAGEATEAVEAVEAPPNAAAPFTATATKMAKGTDANGRTALSSTAVYCSGGQGWQGKGSYTDRMGPQPDAAGDDLNWTIKFTVTWCVKSGAVQCGLSFIETVYEYRVHEVGAGHTIQITPCGTARRDMNIDWDLEFGFCPWCVPVDVDLEMYVNRYGTYAGTWRHNGDGI